MNPDRNSETILWVDPEILTWHMFVGGEEQVEDCQLKRSYRHWEHANDLAANARDEFGRIDIVTTLKRAVDTRLRILDQIYRFKTIPIPEKPKGLYELLTFLGIIRPLLLSRLYAIRRGVEHRDAEPPSLARCKEFVEFVWYFLRSTDILLTEIANRIEFDPESSKYAAYGPTLEMRQDGKWCLVLRGWLPGEFLSMQPRPDWIKICVNDLRKKSDLNPQSLAMLSDPDYPLEFKDADFIIGGRVFLSPIQIKTVFLGYFERT